MSPDSAQERLALAQEKKNQEDARTEGCCMGGCGTVLAIIALGVILINLFGDSRSGFTILLWLVVLAVGVALIAAFISRSR